MTSDIKGLDRAQAAYDAMTPEEEGWCGECDKWEIEEYGLDPATYPLCGRCSKQAREAYREDMADERRKYGED